MSDSEYIFNLVSYTTGVSLSYSITFSHKDYFLSSIGLDKKVNCCLFLLYKWILSCMLLNNLRNNMELYNFINDIIVKEFALDQTYTNK
jgi:hypothetical protein